MVNVKKILSAILAAIMVLSTTAVFSAADGDADANVPELSSIVLEGLGIMDDFSDSLITRKSFTYSAAKLIGFERSDSRTGTRFQDVPENDSAYAAIEFAVERGMINGYGEGAFRPNDFVSQDEAIKIVVSALGYGELAAATGGYPVGYYKTAQSLNLLSGIKASGGEALTCANAARLLYNALDARVLSMSSMIVDANGSYNTAPGKTVLSEYHYMYKYREIVTATQNAGGGRGFAKIGTETFCDANGLADGLFGYEVMAYVYDKDGERELRIIHKTGRNDELTVLSKDIEASTTLTSFAYYNASMALRRANVSPVADMIYNGELYNEFSPSDMMPTDGEVTLIDNDNDGEYDVIHVTQYSIVAVASVSRIDYKITNKYQYNGAVRTLEMDASDREKFLTVTKGGYEASFYDIKADDILLAEVSKSGNVISVEICDFSVTGTITDADINEKIVWIDGFDYDVAPGFFEARENGDLNTPELQWGMSAEFFFDSFDRVAYISVPGDEAASRVKRGYLYKISGGTGLAANAQFKMYTTEDKWEIFTVAKNLRVYYGADLLYRISDHSAIIGAVGEEKLIRYMLNGDGEIADVYLPLENPSGSALDDAVANNTFRAITGAKYWRSENANFDPDFFVTSNTDIFVVPLADALGVVDEDAFMLGSTNNFRQNQSAEVVLYDFDASNFVGAVVKLDPPNSSRDHISREPLFIIDKVSSVSASGEHLQRVYGLLNNIYVSYLTSKPNTFDGIKQGDIVQIHINLNGRIDYFGETGADSGGNQIDPVVHHAGDYAPNASTTTLHDYGGPPVKGDVLAVNGKSIKIRQSDTVKFFRLDQKAPVITVCDMKNKHVTKGSIGDVSLGDFVVIRLSLGIVQEIVVYKR